MAGNILLTLFAIGASCDRLAKKKKKGKLSAIRYRIAISLFFVPLLGAVVITGLISVSYDNLLYGYLFPGLCVLQGIYLVLFYVFLNRKVY